MLHLLFQNIFPYLSNPINIGILIAFAVFWTLINSVILPFLVLFLNINVWEIVAHFTRSAIPFIYKWDKSESVIENI